MCDAARVDKVKNCKLCGASIIMGVTEKGHRMAVELANGGSLVLLRPDPRSGHPERQIRLLRDQELDSVALPQTYRRHATTCPERRRPRG